ncbi:MAG: serine/threonine protein kinase [Pseudolabrys sp.]
MDKVKALEVEAALKGREVGGYLIEKYINHGKSAAVFRASKDGSAAAVKIFDNELIEKYGDKTQLVRIERELTLIGHTEAHLVKIFGGGFDNITKNHFIIMEYLDGPNLKQCLTNVPNELIPKLIEQLAAAAKFLEGRGFVHRDIKPENIILLDGCQRLILLDLGVLRPIGEPSVTDDEGIKAFVGTLQYSSPEFLLRKEEDTIDGWRALTFYQIGGVLHDLIMRRPLFEEFINPYAQLVLAVQQETPVIESATAPAYLIDLAKRCLLKEPKLRTRFITWDDFGSPTNTPPVSSKDTVAKRIALLRAAKKGNKPDVASITKSQLRKTVIDYLKIAARSIRATGAILPPLASVPSADGSGLCVAFDTSAAHGLPHGLRVYVHVDVLDTAAKAIVIHGCASTHKENQDKVPALHTVFEGIYDLPSVHRHFEEFIYAAFSWAQSTPEAYSRRLFWPPQEEDD